METIFKQNGSDLHPVVSFDPSQDVLIEMDFTAANTALTDDIIEDTDAFTAYIKRTLKDAGARYGIGGYAEHRTVYSRSGVFDADEESEEPRRLHLGVDIWGEVRTPVYCPLKGKVHSFAFNNHFGDYGATIILSHTVGDLSFHSLYGHLSLKDIANLSVGKPIQGGAKLAHFGPPEENGHWPPHLHFQLILNLEDDSGDYPGVCKFSERDKYLANCPDPDLLLNMNKFIRR